MNDNKKRILDMLSENKITSDEAYRLLEALKQSNEPNNGSEYHKQTAKRAPKYLRVTVLSGELEGLMNRDKVNVRIPISLIKAGIKLTSLIPPQAFEHIDDAMKEKGFEFDLRNVKKEDWDELIDALSEMEIDVEGSNGEIVKVFVE